MGSTPVAGEIKHLTVWSVVISVLMIVAGLLAMGLPMIAGIAVNVLVAWLLVFCGAAHFLFAWDSRGAGGVVWQVLLGLLYVAIGAYILVHPLVGLAALTLALAIYLLIEGVLELVLGFQLRPLRGSGWLLFDGGVTLVLAILIWKTWPSSAEWVIGFLVGVSMLFSGLTRLMLSLTVRRLISKMA